ncbi:uncharacterized protein neo [Bemisia tabaci]|uniref:uncharacterized protein neo n=1 Tax=Bemisia tabaci TaxID=7038 RepID=UPI0008F9C244|nr:PREDICTED: uncharacterized protein LOC109034575 [Bemisia tabaci]
MADRHLGWALLLTAAISLLPAPASPQETVQGPGFAAKASTLAATTLGPSTTAARDRGKTGTEAAPGAGVADCEPDMIGFELVTGYVFTAPDDLLDSIPGTLMLTDCLEACQNNDTCHSVNYETGLCVMFSSNADKYPGALTKSQFPVFTIYAQKSCLGVKPCERAWCFDRVQAHRLNGYVQRQQTAGSRQECLELCLGEREFPCRSANFNNVTGVCELSDMDRLTVAGHSAFEAATDSEYLENNCVEVPVKLCEFKKLTGRILKTVDSVYQEVGSVDECRELCLNSPYRCHSYDYGDTGDLVCRLSHHSRATLSDIQDPYLNVAEASTYELSACYNVTIDCRAGDMVARIKTSKLFNGKIYAKGSPNSCVKDVRESLDFELEMAYDDVECNVKHQGLGRYLNDVVIQHHDTIVTSSDLGLAVTCQYDLTNKTVSNEVDLGVQGDVKAAMTEEVIVDSPNVAMKITDRAGEDIKASAEVGDPLALRFEILDRNSPYEIFVRELVAMDGVDSSEIVLIDADGCPTDHFIMGPLYKSSDSGKILLSYFDAFKFPSSEVVQFRALVTPCMPTCEPVQCDQEDASGELRSVNSFGRRRRRRRDTTTTTSRDDLLLVETIQITDKFGFNREKRNYNATSAFFSEDPSSPEGLCVNLAGVLVSGAVLVAVQVVVLLAWSYVWQRRKTNPGPSINLGLGLGFNHVARTDSLCKLYDVSYGHGRRY